MKKIKIIIVIIFFGVLMGVFLFFKYRSYDYEVTYVIDQFKIKEIYDKDELYYEFYINSDLGVYPYKIYSEYYNNKEIIDKVEIYRNKNETCILPESEEISFYPLCRKDNKIYTYNLSELTIKEYQIKKHKEINSLHDKIKINYLNNNNFLLYNYKGFYYVTEKKVDEINLFNTDEYKIELIYDFNKYLIVADYNNEYYINKFFIINKKNGEKEEIKFDNEISFNSVFLGHYKNDIYLLDKKEKKEYKINIKNKKIEEISYVILENNKLVNKSINEIINNNLVFENYIQNDYELIDNNLYQVIGDYKLLISNKHVTKIIKEEKETIYYLSNDELYMYNNEYGEILLISYFEWNFNNTNMIYLYK